MAGGGKSSDVMRCEVTGETRSLGNGSVGRVWVGRGRSKWPTVTLWVRFSNLGYLCSVPLWSSW